MAARVTDADVKAIFDTAMDTTPFITTANLIVDEELVSFGLTEARLTEIEKYLAAHFACLKDPRIAKEKIGDAENTYQVVKAGNGLEGTSYGQQVQLLDSTGRLADLLKPHAGLETLKTNVPAWGITGVRGF